VCRCDGAVNLAENVCSPLTAFGNSLPSKWRLRNERTVKTVKSGFVPDDKARIRQRRQARIAGRGEESEMKPNLKKRPGGFPARVAADGQSNTETWTPYSQTPLIAS
jgi:hypothetical protein